MHKAYLKALIIAGLTCSSCSSQQEEVDQHSPSEIHGLRVAVEEVFEGKSTELSPGPVATPVDADSRLAIRLQPPMDAESLRVSPEWLELIELSALVEKSAQDYLRALDLLASVPSHQPLPQEDQDFIDQQASEVLALTNQIVNDETGLISNAEFFELLGNGIKGFPLLTYAIERRQKELSRRTMSQADLREHEVMVRAFHIPRQGTDALAVHVPGYDTLPLGEYRPIDNGTISLLPTGPESDRLRSELAGAKRGVAAIREAGSLGNALEEAGRARLLRFEELARKLQVEVETLFALRLDEFDELLNGVERSAVAAHSSPEAKRVEAAIRSLEATFQSWKDWVTKLETELDQLRRISSTQPDPLQLTGTLLNLAGLVSQGVQDRHADLASIPGQLNELRASSQALGQAAIQGIGSGTADQLLALWSATNADLQLMIQRTKDSVAAEYDALQNWLLASHGSTTLMTPAEVAASLDKLRANEAAALPQPLSTASSSTIDLTRVGWSLEDELRIEVEVREKGAERNPQQRNTEDSLSWSTTAKKIGWHRRYSADLIFARRFDDGKFEPNAAAFLEWHNFDREDPYSFWNKLDLGLGFHAALLDQLEEETTEFGVGVNASILDGFLRLGVGYNLNADDDEWYGHLGIGLTKLLGQVGATP